LPVEESVSDLTGSGARVHVVALRRRPTPGAQLRTLAGTHEILQAREADPGSVPPRLLIPTLQSASLEDEPALVETWSQLPATAAVDLAVGGAFLKAVGDGLPSSC
jgi:hypothetical protein